jgi:tetratricopeptide (TPR) repeat protein
MRPAACAARPASRQEVAKVREINSQKLEERARSLELAIASSKLMSEVLEGEKSDGLRPERYRFLQTAIERRPRLLKALLDDKSSAFDREWSEVLKDNQTDVRFLHGLAVLFREQALAAVPNGKVDSHYWSVSTALWSLLLSSDKFWHYFSQSRLTARDQVERADLNEDHQEGLLEEALRDILALHSNLGSRNFAAERFDQAAVHLRCLNMCQGGRDALVKSLARHGFHYKLSLDEVRLEKVKATASELLDNWCATLVKEAEKAVEDAEAIKSLPKGIRKNYEGGIKRLEKFFRLKIPVVRVLMASLEWYNDWCYDLYVSKEMDRIKELMKPAREVADQLAPLCIKGLDYTPANQCLSQHFMLRGFTSGDPDQAIKEYEEALGWNTHNKNAQSLLGDKVQEVLKKQIDTAIECTDRKQFKEAYEILESAEKSGLGKEDMNFAWAVVYYRHANAMAEEGKFGEALACARKAQEMEPGQEVISDFVKQMEELAPEEENIKHMRGAQEALEEERYDQAIEKAARVLKRSKYIGSARRLQSAAYFYRGITHAEKRQFDKAEGDLREALKLSENPEEREIISRQLEAVVEGDNIRLMNEAQDAMEAEKYGECIEGASKVSTHSKYYGHARRLQSLAYFRRGIAEANQEQFDAAEASLKKALDLNDDAKEQKTIKEQIEALAYAKQGGALKKAFDSGDWTTAEKILRDALKKPGSGKEKKQIEKQLSIVLNLAAVERANRGQKEEAQFGAALGALFEIIKSLQQGGHYPGSYGYDQVIQDKTCPVCNAGTPQYGSKGRGEVVERVVQQLVKQGSFAAKSVTEFWSQHQDTLCWSCDFGLRSITTSKAESIKMLEEAIKLDSSNQAAKKNLAAIKKAG